MMINNTIPRVRELKQFGMPSAVEEQVSTRVSTTLCFEVWRDDLDRRRATIYLRTMSQRQDDDGIDCRAHGLR